MVILSLYWGNLGVKWRNGVAYKSKNAKIKIGLNPPPPKVQADFDFRVFCLLRYAIPPFYIQITPIKA